MGKYSNQHLLLSKSLNYPHLKHTFQLFKCLKILLRFHQATTCVQVIIHHESVLAQDKFNLSAQESCILNLLMICMSLYMGGFALYGGKLYSGAKFVL